MLSHLFPLLTLLLVIFASIGVGAWLVWVLCADSLDPLNLKRTTKGRRSSDR